jgi:molybdopterin synthase sulfur carrier subunit
MAVIVKIPTQLRAATGGVSEASVEGATVAEVLDGLFAQFGELRERISDEQGALRRFVNVYLAGEDIRFLNGVATSVPDGSELTILPAVAGG